MALPDTESTHQRSSNNFNSSNLPKKLGFSLNEIQALLSLKNTKDHPCQNVKEKALEKLHEIEEKLQELHSMHDELSRIVVRCDGQHPSESCAIIHALEATETSTTKS